jgi:hypothetical protein
LIKEKSDNTCIGYLFFLLNGKQTIDSAIDISEIKLCKGFPKDIERIRGFLIIIAAKAF